MHPRRALTWSVILTLLLSAMLPAWALAAGGDSGRQLINRGSTTLTPTPTGSAVYQTPEFPRGIEGDEGASTPPTNRSKSRGHGAKQRSQLTAPVVQPTAIDGAQTGLGTSFDGLTMFDQRTADDGNQFSVEPPDQALCVSSSYVLESVNDVLRVYDKKGNALAKTVTSLNKFYGYPSQYNRETGEQGPFLTDPVCHFDPDTQRWFHVVLTLDVFPDTGEFTGTNHLDIAVSQSSDPTKSWTIFSIPVQDDGTAGTPNHRCDPGAGPTTATNPNACIGDYPHIGADRYGIYITTNEYSLFGSNYNGAQVYAISKKALAASAKPATANAPTPRFIQFDNLYVEKAGTLSFTVWPALSPAGDYATANGGTEYFLSSMAGEEAGNTTGLDNRIALWALTNTQSLDTTRPALTLSSRSLDSETYGVPPLSEQKAGSVPLADCLNAGCFGPDPYREVEGKIDSNDSRMQQVSYANGYVWGALDTIVNVNGVEKAGIAYFVVKPVVIGNGQHVGPQSEIVKQGYLAVAGNNVTRPAIAMLANGRGVMALNVVGTNYYPTAAYSFLSLGGASPIHIARLGVGPQDGFSEYHFFASDPNNPRPRWGDYAAAAVDGNRIWIASEYIGQTCTYAQFRADSTCGGTRATLGNWGTRVSSVDVP